MHQTQRPFCEILKQLPWNLHDRHSDLEVPQSNMAGCDNYWKKNDFRHTYFKNYRRFTQNFNPTINLQMKKQFKLHRFATSRFDRTVSEQAYPQTQTLQHCQSDGIAHRIQAASRIPIPQQGRPRTSASIKGATAIPGTTLRKPTTARILISSKDLCAALSNVDVIRKKV